MIIAVAQHKGGTGKTSTVLNLGAALAEKGHRVLLVDLDPQADLSAGLGIEVDLEDKHQHPTLYTVLAEEQGTLAKLVAPGGLERLSLVPGTLDMADLELHLAPQIGRERVLESALAEVTGRYDYILLDCPPSLGLITVNALVAADWVLIPVQAEPRSIRATKRMLAAVGLVQRKLKRPDLRVLGFVLTMTGTSNITKEAEELLRATYGDRVLKATIRRRVRVTEDTLYRAPVLAFAPRSQSADDFRALADEVLARTATMREKEIAHAS
ncbi:MAG: ParA family protein [Chloroflexota bacterium]|nr:ParA family protein [Chloroflexota bacterium]MDQ5866633.1 ParA family protein [Chloroflexota bacterium]